MTSRFEELHPKPIEIKCLPDELNKKCNESNLLKWNLIREGWLEALKLAYRQEDRADIYNEINAVEKEK